MKLLYNNNNKDDRTMLLENYVQKAVCSDYIYDYPPRQAYRAFDDIPLVIEKIKESLMQSDDINLYYHFPFCKQICSYCNLFAICETNQNEFEEYFKALKKETGFFLPYIKGKRIKSLYLGGGTPSLINPELMGNFLEYLQKEIGFELLSVPEVAMELSPDTATKERLLNIRKAGINRVNIGVQAVSDSELFCIGRKYSKDTIYSALLNVMNADFDNVCVDLIYGLESQSKNSWEESVKQVITYKPQTICAYPLTLRENTPFSRKGYREIDGFEQYEKYTFARDYLLSQGYEQETHVRYKRVGSKGGYIQKENHWNQQNILGFGAGARSYLKEINTRNGYSVLNRRKIYKEYINAIEEKSFAVVDGFIMDVDEKMRKQIVLGLDGLNLSAFAKTYGVSFYAQFPQEIDYLLKNGYIEEKNGGIFFTKKGTQYRDLIVQLFFSENINQKVADYDYNE